MSKKRKIAITTDGSEVWVNEGADIVNHQKVEDVYSKSVKFLKSKTKKGHKWVTKTDKMR